MKSLNISYPLVFAAWKPEPVGDAIKPVVFADDATDGDGGQRCEQHGEM